MIWGNTKPVIEHLRKKWPGKWKYLSKSHTWVGPQGRHVYWVAASAPQYDGDDSTVSELWCYSPSGSERVL